MQRSGRSRAIAVLAVVLKAAAAAADPAGEHVMVYDEPGRFAAWPANGTLAIWGDELVVHFEAGWFRDKPDHEDGHARDDRPSDDIVARSLDGDLSARTDYVLRGPRTSLFFFAAEPEGATDRAFCAVTDDGGVTFEHRGWVTDPDPPDHERWAFPSTVDDGGGHLLTAVRRKDERALRNWIDLYASDDDGRTWTRRSRVADTAVDGEPFNGNPPSMLRLEDGRLAVVYGVRAAPYRMALRFSGDDGRTWSDEVTLRDGARNWDLGYPRSVQRADGKVVTVYYFATPQNRDQFIAATIWDPAALP